MAIELCGVSKRFGDTRAVDGVSLRLEENTIYGLLGNNGAGKSTLLHLITGRLLPDSGTITLDGAPVAEHDAALGQLFLVGESNLFPTEMRVKRAFAVTARFYPTFNIVYALSLAEKFGLDVKKKITALSTGYGSIFRLILALSVNTPYVFLDEPVLGLDAQHRDLFYQLLLEKYLEHPCTIVISTHLIQEVAALIAHTVILRDGRVLRDCPADALSDAVTISGAAAAVDSYVAGRDILSTRTLGGLKSVCIQGAAGDLPEGLEQAPVGLQEYFIALMEQEVRV